MSKKILQVIGTAYRATLEEQDDPVLWLAASLKGNGLSTDLLLRADAVNYLVRSQDASGLEFGDRKQTQPPRLAAEVERLIASGVGVYFVEEDLAARGISREEIVDAHPVAFEKVVDLFTRYEGVWSW